MNVTEIEAELRRWVIAGADPQQCPSRILHPDFEYVDHIFRVGAPDAADHLRSAAGAGLRKSALVAEYRSDGALVMVVRGEDPVTLLWHQEVFAFTWLDDKLLRLVKTASPPVQPLYSDGTLPLQYSVPSAGSTLPTGTSGERAPLSIAVAGNALAPAILALEARGFTVSCTREAHGETWTASRQDIRAVGQDPPQLLGLLAVVQGRGQRWQATDEELATILRRFQLD